MKYYIIGSGGQARQVLSIAHSLNPPLDVYGFIAPKVDKIYLVNGVEVIDETSFIQSGRNSDLLLNGLGRPERKNVIDSYLRKGFSFTSLIHPSSTLGEFTVVGNGTIIQAGVRITTNVQIGNFVLLDLNCTVGHDVSIGDYTTISTGVSIAGGAQIGSGCWIGSGAIIIEDIKIGNGSLIGAGSVVTRDVEENTLAYGVPAKAVRKIESVSQELKRK